MEFTFLGGWGLAVLLAAMAGTQRIKASLKRRGVENDYLFMALPLIISVIGASTLAIAGEITWRMVPLFTFVAGLAGNSIFKAWKARRGGPNVQ